MDLKVSEPSNERLSYQDFVKKSEVRYDSPFERPEICISVVEGVERYEYATLGNFSAILGRQKSRKTFYSSMLLGAVIKGGIIQDKFKGELQGKNHLLFDTEQSQYHLQWVVKRACHLAGVEGHPPNFQSFWMKTYSPEDRVEYIEEVLKNTPNVGYVGIDGVRDLVYDINDPREATTIITKIMQWVSDYNCHISVVLHVNKGDGEARGHLGTEVVNKAESVVVVEKDPQEGDFSTVVPKNFRGKEFSEIAFEIKGHLPTIVTGYMPVKNKEPLW